MVEAPEEMSVYKCPRCGGRAKTIVDMDAFNQIISPGFSSKIAERNRRLSEQAVGPCPMCNGRGFILKPKTVTMGE